jgi:hypothetical protein
MVNEKMVNRSVFCILCSVLLLAGCNHDDYLGGHYTTEGQGVQARIQAVSATEHTNPIVWTEGSQIAVTASYLDAGSLNRFYDCQSDGKSFSVHAGLPMYIKGQGSFVAYAPVQGLDGEETVIELNTANQQDVVDYVYAVEPVSRDNAEVTFRFKHFYSNLHTTLKTAASEHIRKVILSGFSHAASVNPYTWEISAMDAPSNYTLASESDITAFDLTLIPQSIDSSSVMPVQLTLIGTNRFYKLTLNTFTLESDKELTMAVDISQPEPTVSFSFDGVTWTNYEDKLKNGVSFESDTVVWTITDKGGDVTSN